MSKLVALAFLIAIFSHPADASPSEQSYLIPADVCGADLVFLGEASHGGGQAILAKASIGKTLIEKCGFDQIAFESQMYDFLDLSPPVITLNQLRNAIGGIWSTSSESDAFFEQLIALANRNKLRIVGIDGQLGSSTSLYAREALARELTVGMPSNRAEECSKLVNRLTNWTFDKENQKDHAFDANLMSCIYDANSIALRKNNARGIRITENFSRFLSFKHENYFNERDRLMAENLKQELHRGTKTIVWTANIHAARSAVETRSPLASYFGKSPKVKSIAITASTGNYCMFPCSHVQPLAESSDQSLESKLSNNHEFNRFIPLRKHQKFAISPAKLLNYSKEISRSWPALFDYVILLPYEKHATHVRPAKPM